MSVRDRATVLAYLLGWRVLRLLPERTAYRCGERVADLVARRDGRGVQRLRANLARAVDGPVGDALVRQAVRSYVRYWVDAARLADWDESRLQHLRLLGHEAELRGALAAGRGVVGALAHLGSWDHAGAWSNRWLAPVTTVAERVRPVAVFDRFVALREGVGMQVIAHDEPDVVARLEATLRAGGFVPLLADRDLSRRGVVVDLLGEPARLASGPAVLAGRTGALLVPVGITYRRDATSPSGWGLDVRLHAPVDVPDDSPPTVLRATAAVARALGESIRERPADWHMLQRVFVRDLADGGPGPRAPT